MPVSGMQLNSWQREHAGGMDQTELCHQFPTGGGGGCGGGTCSIQQPPPGEEAGALSHWDGPDRGQLVGKDSWGSQGQATRLQGSYRQGRREEISKTWPADWSPREHTPPGPGGMSLTVQKLHCF